MQNTKPTAFSINFRLNKQRTKQGKAAIYLRLTVNGKRLELSTNQYLELKSWDQKNQCAYNTSEELKEVNRQLVKIKSAFDKHYSRMSALDLNVTAELLKNEYLGITERQKTLKELMDFYHERFKEKVAYGKKSSGTLKIIHTTIEKVKVFVKYRFKVSDILLSEIKGSFTSDFEHFLITRHGLSNNSAMKYIRMLKRIAKFAVDQDWLVSCPISKFKCSYNEPVRERLTIEEVMVLYKKELHCDRLSEVRDVFVFCCFTGFSYMDVYKLTPENLVKGIDGGIWVTKEREKTKTNERVPLLPIAMEIIERYKNSPYCQIKGCLLPVNTNQCYNAFLKEIAVICKVNKHLTTHTARHTFATAITLENDVPIETVSQMLGHKSIKTTQIYAKVTQKKISNNMKDLNGKLASLLNTTTLEKDQVAL
ncbi:MAG: site-specific integrase [Sediminibacterium sp.]